MKRIVFLAVFMAIICMCVPKVDANGVPGQKDEPEKPEVGPADEFQEEPDDKALDVAGLLDYAILTKAGHPRLILDDAGFEDLKTKISSGRFTWKTLYKLHSSVVNRAQAALNEELVSAASHEDVVNHLLSLSYAYKTTGKASYLEKATADLKKVCSWPDWNPGSFLSTGEIAMSVAIAYDWLYHNLDLATRKAAHKAMVNNGLMEGMNNSYQSCIGNWNQVCNAGMILSALAIYEKDKAVARKACEKMLPLNLAAMKGIYEPDGAYLEGIGYWEYGTTSELFIIASLDKIFGSDYGLKETKGFMESGRYVSFMHGTMNTSFSYADGGGNSDTCCMGSWWFAAQTHDTSYAWCEKHNLDAGYYESREMRRLALVPCVIKDFNMDEAGFKAPEGQVWSGQGDYPVAMVRRGWNFDASDTFLGIKGGQCNTWNTNHTAHGHMDIGSFVFESEGVRWSDDIMRPSYSAWFSALQKAGSRSGDTSQVGLRWDTFRVNNLCHSCLVAYSNDGSVAGKIHPNDYWVDGTGTIEEVYDNASRQGARMDMTQPMKGQVKKAARTIVLEGSDLVVIDEVTALDGMDAPLEWRMLTMTASSVGGSCITLSKPSDSKIRRQLTVSADSGDAPVFRTWATKKPDTWSAARDLDQSISGRSIVGWTATVPAGKTVTFTTRLSLEK